MSVAESTANNAYSKVKAVQNKIQETLDNADKKLVVKHRLFRTNGLAVKSTGTNSLTRTFKALRRRQASDQDTLKALKHAAKKDFGKLGPKAVDRYMATNGASLRSENLTEDVNKTASNIKTLFKTINQTKLALREKGFDESTAERLTNDIFNDFGSMTRSASKMLRQPVTANILLAYADKKYAGENIRFLMDVDRYNEIMGQLDNQKCDTPAEQQAVNAKKHAVYDFLIDRHLIQSGDLNLEGCVKKMAADCSIGPGTDSDQTLARKKALVNKMIAAVQTNANDTQNRLIKNTTVVDTIERMSMDQINQPMSKHGDGTPFLTLELAEAAAKKRTTILTFHDPTEKGAVKPHQDQSTTVQTVTGATNPDSMQTNSDNVSSIQAAQKTSQGQNTENVNPTTPQPKAASIPPQAQSNATSVGRTDANVPRPIHTPQQDETQATSGGISASSTTQGKVKPDTQTPTGETQDTGGDVSATPTPQGTAKAKAQTLTGKTQATSRAKSKDSPTGPFGDMFEALRSGKFRSDEIRSGTLKPEALRSQNSFFKKLDDAQWQKMWVIVNKIQNHPNIPQLTQNELAELDGMIANPAYNEVEVAQRAEKILNGKK